VSEQQRYEVVPAAYRPPMPYAHNPGELVPVTSTRPAPATAPGSALRRAAWLLPLAGTAVPLVLGRMWHAHGGGHSLGAWGLGALGLAGVAFAVTQRDDPGVAVCVAGLGGLVVEFSIDAYAPEIFLPLGLWGLAAVAVYGAVARVRVKFALRRQKTGSTERVEQTRADAQVETARLGAWAQVASAAIDADARVKIAQTEANARVQVAQVQATAITALSASHPLLALSDTARAALDGTSAVPAAEVLGRPARVIDAA
jgi:hypothetical protein